MVTKIVQSKEEVSQEEKNKDLQWEERSYQRGCKVAREEAERELSELEQRLHEQRSASLKVIGWRERTLMTCFGEIKVKRRFYQDEGGGYHFLLDEYQGWTKAQVATPKLEESVVELASEVPSFRLVSRTLEKLTAGVLSTSTLLRLVSRVGERAIEGERRDWEACFEHGELPGSEDKVVDVLYIEADGIWVHLQQEDQKWLEIKDAIAYEGWQRLPQKEERYKLVGKRVYCQGEEENPFWEGASVEFSRKWDLSQIKQVVISGDGASWIDEGAEWFPNAILQRDGFHLARNIRRAFEWDIEGEIYLAIREGRTDEAVQLINTAGTKEGKGVKKALKYLSRQIDKGVDWRNQVAEIPPLARGLGTMESQEGSLIADRMKIGGMSWTKKGARHMAKVIQLVANEELANWCRQPIVEKNQKDIILHHLKHNFKQDIENDETLQYWDNIPAFYGSDASQPWVQKLRQLAYNTDLLN